MTDTVAVALISGAFGSLTAAISVATLIVARRAKKQSETNHQTLESVVRNTNGNVEKLQQEWAKEARRREEAAWQAAFEAGRRAEMTKNRRATDLMAVERTVNDDEPKE